MLKHPEFLAGLQASMVAALALKIFMGNREYGCTPSFVELLAGVQLPRPITSIGIWHRYQESKLHGYENGRLVTISKTTLYRYEDGEWIIEPQLAGECHHLTSTAINEVLDLTRDISDLVTDYLFESNSQNH